MFGTQRGQSPKRVEKQSSCSPQKNRQRDNDSYHEQGRKIKVQLDSKKHYDHLKAPMVKTTQEKADEFIRRLHRGEHIVDMTKKWP